ncbi:MAG TPA: hypothetical protein PKY56_13975, partial [Candidatus Kapabacteria bacterium]|nr:hypothetical protein [Candidatus Kapabacteria bacterium]
MICKGAEANLMTSKKYYSYQWSTGENTQAISINSPGVYSVIVTDKFGCVGYDTVNVAQSEYIAYYSFNDSTAIDLSGNGFNGTLMNNPTPVKGVNGGTALYFHTRSKFGNGGDHILLPRIPFESFQQFSISMWVKEDSLSDQAGEAYFWLGNYDTGWFGIGNFLETNLDPINNIQFAVGANSEINPIYSEFIDSYRNKWIHYAMTYKNKKVKAFINGVLIDSTEQDINIQGDYAAIASHKFGDLISTRFQGAIDEVKIFCGALTDEEIKEIYEVEEPITDCIPVDFELNQVINSKINYIENAVKNNDAIRISNASRWTKGAIWYKDLVPLANGFETTYSFKVTDGYQAYPYEYSEPGADGITFVIQNNNNSIVGRSAGDMGYTDIPNSIAIELDFYTNTNYNDPDDNHLAVQSNKQGINTAMHNSEYTLGLTSNIPHVKSDGSEIYFVKIYYDSELKKLMIYMNTTEEFTVPVLTIDNFQIEDYLDLDCSCAYVGFVSTTGDSYQN